MFYKLFLLIYEIETLAQIFKYNDGTYKQVLMFYHLKTRHFVSILSM